MKDFENNWKLKYSQGCSEAIKQPVKSNKF